MDVEIKTQNGVDNLFLTREITSVARTVDAVEQQQPEQRYNMIPMSAVAFWGKLLQTDSVDETLRFILFVRDNPVDSCLDQETGLTVWAPAYEQLMYDAGEIDELTLGGVNATRQALGLPLKSGPGISLMAEQSDSTAYLSNAAWECFTKLESVDGLLDKIEQTGQSMVDSFLTNRNIFNNDDEEVSQDG